MVAVPNTGYANFLDPTQQFPDDQKQITFVLRNSYFNTAQCVNNREISLYPLEEILCGNQWYTEGNAQKYRSVFRKVIKIGAVTPGGVAVTTPHGVTGITEFTNIYGVATTATRSHALPYASVAANGNVEMYADATNVVVQAGAAATAITKCVIVLEYVKQ